MEFGGTYLFFTQRKLVWRALNDTNVLKHAIPRCEVIEWRSDSTLDLTIKVNLGVMKPKFSGELELSDIIEAQSYVLSGRGHGGLLGLARGAAKIDLRDHLVTRLDIDDIEDTGFHTSLEPGEKGTVLSFSAQGGASKAIMSLGKNIIGKSAQGVIDRFMGRFSEAMEVPVLPLNEELEPTE